MTHTCRRANLVAQISFMMTHIYTTKMYPFFQNKVQNGGTCKQVQGRLHVAQQVTALSQAASEGLEPGLSQHSAPRKHTRRSALSSGAMASSTAGRVPASRMPRWRSSVARNFKLSRASVVSCPTGEV